MRIVFSALAVLTLAACNPTVPDSGVGVGFGDYDSYQTQREAALSGESTVRPPMTTSVELVTPGDPSGSVITPAAPSVVVDTNNPGISDEQNFGAVSSRETIESDRERLAAQAQAYETIAPTPVPERGNNVGPNIVQFALSTNNRVGQETYRRLNPLRNATYDRNCSRYPSPDLAQEAFLKSGGPERDRLGLDPDGDGFACAWDPTPFRQAVGN